MSQNTNSWWQSWLKPSNLIALAALVAAIWGGVTIFANKQEVNLENSCDLSNFKQVAGDKPSSSQSLSCDNSTGKDIIQE